MRVVLEGAALAQLRSAELKLEPGRYVVLSSEGDALSCLIAVLAGRQPPSKGQVLVDGLPPATKARRPPHDRGALLRRRLAARQDRRGQRRPCPFGSGSRRHGRAGAAD